MTSYTPRTATISGSDLGGSDGAVNRTYTLTAGAGRTILTSSVVVVSGRTLVQGSSYDFTVSTADVVTFLVNMDDTDTIVFTWFDVTATTSDDDTYYTNEYNIVRKTGIGVNVVDETLGTGDDSEDSYKTENPSVIRGSYSFYYAASGSYDTTTLTETTHYSIDLDSGRVLLTGAGITALSTNILYGKYIYTTNITNTELNSILDEIDEEVDRMTGKVWGTAAQKIDYFDGRKSFTYPTTDAPYAEDWDEPDTVQLTGNVTEVDNVFFLVKGQIFSTVFSSDGGSYTDNTEEANSVGGTAFYIFAETPASSDEFYFSSSKMFTGVNLRLSQLGVDSGSLDVDWYYYNGSSWSALTVTAQTSGADDFTASGRVTWDYITDWQKTTVNSSDSLFYIKAVLTTTSYSTSPKMSYMALDQDNVISKEISLAQIDWNSDGRLTFTNDRIPNGNRVVKVIYKGGQSTQNPLIEELASLIGGLKVFAKITGGSIDTPSLYTLPEATISVGQLYVNVESVAKSFRSRIKEIINQLGMRISLSSI